MTQNECAARAVRYIEDHLDEPLDLETVARAMHYSKFHLHRMFTDAAGMPMHRYIRRRRLTEAARLLVFSDSPVMEAALTAGFASRQAFTDAFRAMYKRAPAAYREEGTFYPLQLELTLHPAPSAGGAAYTIDRAAEEDIPAWMALAPLVIDGFPRFEEAAHLRRLRRCVEQGRALLLRDQGIPIGAAAFSRQAGSIDFFGIHPQYRRRGAAEALLDWLLREEFSGREVGVTTFREGDRADPGQRAAFRRLGFAGAELGTEFGYPVQRMVLRPGKGAAPHA